MVSIGFTIFIILAVLIGLTIGALGGYFGRGSCRGNPTTLLNRKQRKYWKTPKMNGAQS